MWYFGWIAVALAVIDFITGWHKFQRLDNSAGRAYSLEGSVWVIIALICFK